jgi:iron complex transport system substrate-binding protein
MVAYADAVDAVVGVEQLETKNEKRPFRPYNHANPELAETTSIGSRKNPESELVLRQEPDAIFYAWANAGKADKLQRKLGIPVVVITPGDLNPALRDDFFATMRLVGDVLGTSEAAESVIDHTKSLTNDLSERTSDVPKDERPRSYVGYLGRGKHGFNYTQPLYPPFHFVNANNVASGVTEDLKKKKGAARVTIDREQIIKWDPEYLFVDTGTEKYDALNNPEYRSITAIQEDNVYRVFPTRDYSINFGTVFADAYYIGSVLYPDRFSDVDPAAKADSIYEGFVGEPVYEQVADSYGQGFGPMDV